MTSTRCESEKCPKCAVSVIYQLQGSFGTQQQQRFSKSLRKLWIPVLSEGNNTCIKRKFCTAVKRKGQMTDFPTGGTGSQPQRIGRHGGLCSRKFILQNENFQKFTSFSRKGHTVKSLPRYTCLSLDYFFQGNNFKRKKSSFNFDY